MNTKDLARQALTAAYQNEIDQLFNVLIVQSVENEEEALAKFQKSLAATTDLLDCAWLKIDKIEHYELS